MTHDDRIKLLENQLMIHVNNRLRVLERDSHEPVQEFMTVQRVRMEAVDVYQNLSPFPTKARLEDVWYMTQVWTGRIFMILVGAGLAGLVLDAAFGGFFR